MGFTFSTPDKPSTEAYQKPLLHVYFLKFCMIAQHNVLWNSDNGTKNLGSITCKLDYSEIFNNAMPLIHVDANLWYMWKSQLCQVMQNDDDNNINSKFNSIYCLLQSKLLCVYYVGIREQGSDSGNYVIFNHDTSVTRYGRYQYVLKTHKNIFKNNVLSLLPHPAVKHHHHCTIW